jgi:regulator of nucleoside diphosphate kinase
MKHGSADHTRQQFIITFFVVVNGVILQAGLTRSAAWYHLLWITVPAMLLPVLKIRRSKPSNSTEKDESCKCIPIQTNQRFYHMHQLTTTNINTHTMKPAHETPIIKQDDFNTIMNYLKTGETRTLFNKHDVEDLRNEMQRATVLPQEQLFPADVVGLNSRVSIKDEQGKVFELVVVTPKMADIKTKKISVMSPIGRALIGYRKGQTIKWKVPAGEKTFTILDVQ